MAMAGDTEPDDIPPVTKDIGLPTPPSPGRLPPPHLPPPEPGQGEADAERDEPPSPAGGGA